MTRFAIAGVLLFATVFLGSRPCMGQLREDAAVRSASGVLNDIMAVHIKAIPHSLLADAEAIAIVPNVVKGSFVVGVRHGKGVVITRDEHGGWRPPQFVSLTGGSVGFQVGVQATDVILVFKTRKSVDGLMEGKFTIGADAAAAAGPVGRNAAAATDAQLKSEIYSYSRSRGLFAGVSLDGSVLEVDRAAGGLYYRGSGLSPEGIATVENARLPESASILLAQIAQYTAPVVVSEGPEVGGTAPPIDLSNDAPTVLRGQLVQYSRKLQALLDEGWQRYLALPAEVYGGRAHPAPDALVRTVTNYDIVAANPQYRELTSRPEFRNTHEALRRYVAALDPHQSPTLRLPPPPNQQR